MSSYEESFPFFSASLTFLIGENKLLGAIDLILGIQMRARHELCAR